jgi:HSP20 family protein
MPRALMPWGGTRIPQMFEEFREEMDELMGRLFTPEGDGRHLGRFLPQHNLAETDKEYVVTLDLPGVKPEDLDVQIREGDLRIIGERKAELAEEGKTYRHVGCRYGRFEKVIPLELPVKPEQVHAEYKDGVLQITVPKDESVQPKRIEVKAL